MCPIEEKEKRPKVAPFIRTVTRLFHKPIYFYIDNKHFCLEPELDKRKVKGKIIRQYAHDDFPDLYVCAIKVKRKETEKAEEAFRALAKRLSRIHPDYWNAWQHLYKGVGLETRREAEGLYPVIEEEDIKE